MVGNDPVNRWDLLGLCCPGERRNCVVSSYVRVSPNEQALWDDWDDTKETLEDLTEAADAISAAEAGSSVSNLPKALYDAADDSDEEAIDQTDKVVPDMLDYVNRLRSRDKPFTIYVIVKFEECVKKFFGCLNEFEEKSEKVGPFRVDYGNGPVPFPANAGPTASELHQMGQFALDAVCPSKK
jgi:hypothetical protein